MMDLRHITCRRAPRPLIFVGEVKQTKLRVLLSGALPSFETIPDSNGPLHSCSGSLLKKFGRQSMESNLDTQQTVRRIHTMKSPFLLLTLVVACAAPALAQVPSKSDDPDPAYTKTITERADKIVATLGIDEPARAKRVRDTIAQQYRDLRAIHDPREAQIKAAKEIARTNKEAADAAVKIAQDEAKTGLDKLHGEYLAKLAAELTPDQVDKVKDGMTYGVVQVTYKAYLTMLPELNDEQKARIMAYLVEARETAMDLGSSDEKHQWFGKYKGRINNYLSAAGYDLKAASKQSSKPAGGAVDRKAE